MPFCPEGFAFQPPRSMVVIAPDMTEPLTKYLDNPDTLARIQSCLAAGMTKSRDIAAAVDRDRHTVCKYLRQMKAEA
jgi:hypothetical protein